MPGSIPAPQPANLKFHIYFMLSQGKKFLWSHLPVFQNHPTSLVSQCVCAQLLNHARLIGASWTLACQAPLPMEFSRQEHWSGVPFPTPRDLPDPGIEPTSLVSPALAGGFFTTGPPGKPKRLAKKSCMPFLNEAFKSNLLFPIYLETCNKGYFLT